MKTLNEMEDDYFDNYDDEYEGMHESCPACGRSYDDIDFDYQSCSKCGWDVDENKYNNAIVREPDEIDYLNGDADILTDEWN